MLLQDLEDSPHLFGKAFTRELSLVKGTLLQYVDDLLKLIREQLFFSLLSRTRASVVKTDPVQLDSVALGWPSFLWAASATALLVNEASKVTLGQPLDTLTSHQV